MGILNILLGIILGLLGFPVGLFLRKIAKEEIKPGRKYFFWMKNIILVLSVVFVLYSFHLHLILFLIIGIVLTLILLKLNLKYYYGYLIFVLLIVLSLRNGNLFILTCSMLFLYGLPSAGLLK